MDFRNTFLYHLIVALASILLAFIFYRLGIELNRAVAGVAFILLLLTLIIGPIMRIWRPTMEALPWNLPWSWRGELGIWFMVLSIGHVALVLRDRQWDITGYLQGMRLADMVGLAALFIALVLTVTSFGKIIKYLGVASWRWLHSFTYVVFYLVGAHVINHAFLRPDRPEDWLHWLYPTLMIVVIILQVSAFWKTVMDYQKSLKSKN